MGPLPSPAIARLAGDDKPYCAAWQVRGSHFYRLHAHHGLLAPDLIGRTPRGDTHLFFQIATISAALAVGVARNRVAHGLMHDIGNALDMPRRVGCHASLSLQH